MRNLNCLAGVLLFFPFLVLADQPSPDFSELAFDELMQVEITSVSKKSEKLSEAAAAVYVVTGNEIRRSGAISIPEALRLVPGVDVAQIDPNKWAVGIRGFNGRLANKLLVLIDGRSVYTPTYSGVYWEYLDYLLADIERIEVIRGPGATLWGANAVNGVINIITREAGDTQGGLLSLGAGNELKGLAEVRQGYAPSENVQMRVYAKAKRLDQSQDLAGIGQDNGGDYLQTGLRLDLQHSQDQWLTFQGDLYRDDLQQQHTVPTFESPYINQVVNGNVEAQGGNLGVSWGQIRALDAELKVKFTYDFYNHQDLKYSERRDTLNFELQHQFAPFTDHELLWGTGYRWSRSDVTSSSLISAIEPIGNSNIWNLFVQDTIRFPVQHISLTLGAKLESNSYTGSEVQPNFRASWVPSKQLTLWGAVSRAMRTPSRGETGFILNVAVAPPAGDANSQSATLLQVVGQQGFQSEQLDAYELGARLQPHPALAIDIASFYNKYSNLRGYNRGEATVQEVNDATFVLLPFDFSNNTQGQSSGFELLTTWQASSNSRFRFAYSLLNFKLEDTQSNASGGNPFSSEIGRSPKHQVSLWGSFDLSPAVELDLRLYYVDQRSWSTDESKIIAGHSDADLRLGWQPTASLTLSLVGRNLFNSAKQEFIAEPWSAPSQIERSVFLQGALRW